jgi:transcriptional regulator with XRE-family HTH domain
MKKDAQTKTVFSQRLKQARVKAGFTQAKLGVLAGIEEFTASARINQYERAVHAPDYGTAERIAEALGIPISYLFEPNDKIAEFILTIGALRAKDRDKLMVVAQSMLG